MAQRITKAEAEELLSHRLIQMLGEPQKKSIVCALLGHTNIVNICIGQVTCSRCHAIVGDALIGNYDSENSVVVGCDCGHCRHLYKNMRWEDKLMSPEPFPRKDGA